MNTAYDTWFASRRFASDLSGVTEIFEDATARGFVFMQDESFIQLLDDGRYWTIASNEDVIMDTFEEAAKWLWNNWSRYNVEDEVTIDPQLG